MSAVAWANERPAPRILVVDGAGVSQDIDSQAMAEADTVACVTGDVVHIVKNRNYLASGAVTVEEWLKFVGRELRRPGAQVIQVDAAEVGRTC